MSCTETTYQAPPDSGNVFLGRTLPSLLSEACDRAPNTTAFNRWTGTKWQPLSNQTFRATAEAVAVGLVNLGLETGDRVALLMHSDVNFCIVDFGCLLAHLVNVPIDLTQTLEHIIFTLRHSEARALIISNLDLLAQIVPYLWDTPNLQYIIVADAPEDWQQARSQWITSHPNGGKDTGQSWNSSEIPESACLWIPMFLHPAHLEQPHPPFPQCIQLISLNEVQVHGQTAVSADKLQQLYTALSPHDLATIVYIPDEMGQMQGVMLTHENLSANALTSFSSLPNLKRGKKEILLTFLPLNHVLARTLLYGHIHYGHSVYFSNPNRLMKHLSEVHPTILVTVPLLLEKIYSKITEVGARREKEAKGRGKTIKTIVASLTQLAQLIFSWALTLAKQYELGHHPKGVYALQLKLADWLVFSKWRSLFGGRLKYLICGGAALKAELANVFAAAGVTILQGYGLTQASAVVCCNRGLDNNRAGTVGMPIAGAEVAIADDGEILIRGPYVTSGYYQNPAATQELIDAQGWLHTGDLGAFTQEGFLKITGLKKSLFKLSTGKYIAPQPIEQRLKQSPLVAEAIAVGSEQKFCAMLIIPNLEALYRHAQRMGIDLPSAALLEHPCVIALYRTLVDAANCHLPYWALVKRFRLINATFTIENELLTPTGTVNRAKVLEVFANEIKALYEDGVKGRRSEAERRRGETEKALPVSLPPAVSEASCPTFAQSLNPRLTTLNSIATFMLYTSMAVPRLYERIAG
jgi:long-chain acyl-CoA synthetase